MDILISKLNLNNFIKKDARKSTHVTPHIRESFGQINMSNVSKTEKAAFLDEKQGIIEKQAKSNVSKQFSPDPRLKSEQFRQKVRRVFEHLGIANSQGNFNQWDGLLNWDKIDRSIDHPTRLAIYHTRGRSGDIIEILGRPVVSAQEIATHSESEASEILAKESKVFVKWWKPTRFDCGEAVMAELRKEIA